MIGQVFIGKRVVTLGLLLAGGMVFNGTSPVQALTPSSVLYNVPVPPDQGAPVGRQQGGAGRGTCQEYESLTALVPVTQDMVWGQTATDHPSFWFYVPQALMPDAFIEFVVLDAADDYVYSVRLADIDMEAGLIHFALPPSAEPLAVGSSYSWTLSIYCNPEDQSESIFVSGVVQRVAAPAMPIPDSPLEQGQFYADQGLWYDALHALALAHKGDRTQSDLAQAWSALLQQAGLESLATAPFSTCCTSNP